MSTNLEIFIRSLARQPVLAISALVALALGLGATAVAFAFVDGMLWAPLPYPEPEELVRVWDHRVDAGAAPVGVAPGRFVDWRESVESFSGLAAATGGPAHLTGGAEPLAVRAHRATASFFPTLGLAVEAGRWFTEEEVATGAPVAVLHRDLARRRFGAASPLGREVRIDGEPRRVIGVAAGRDPLGEPEVWLPLSHVVWTSRVSHFLEVFARLREGATVEQAREELAAAAATAARAHPETDAGWDALLVPLHDEVVAPVRQPLRVLLAAVLAVLLVVCVNVACLLLARGLGRRREMAIRTAMGADRGSLARLLLGESLSLSLVGAVLGLGLGAFVVGALKTLAPAGLPRLEAVSLGVAPVLLTLGAALGTGLLAGVLPALELRRLVVSEALKEEGRRGGAGRSGSGRWFDRLVVVEVALALVLLTASALLGASFARLSRVDLGFEPEGLLAVEVSPVRAGYRGEAERADLYRRLVERLAALPGVESAAAASRVPLAGEGAELRFLREEAAGLPAAEQPSAEMRAVTPGYFETLGLRVLAGRGLGSGDAVSTGAGEAGAGDTGAGPVVLVNRELARRTWPGGAAGALGRRLSLDGPEGPWRTVVGVVEDVRHFGPGQPVRPEMYVPLSEQAWPSAFLVLRRPGDPAALSGAVRRALAEVDPDLPPLRVVSLEQLYREALAAPRFGVALMGLFAGLGLVLAAVGLYGTQSYAVSLRRHEIGVRMSLGARRATILRLVLGRALLLAAWGVVAGILLSLLAGRALSGLLFGVRPWDPATLLSVVAVLLAVLLLAAWRPAARAAAVDPLTALRSGE